MVMDTRAHLITREIHSALYDEAYKPVAITGEERWSLRRKGERLHTLRIEEAAPLPTGLLFPCSVSLLASMA